VDWTLVTPALRATIHGVLSRHQRIVLLFSGGKDSLACLLLLFRYWDRITVVWTNTGAAFPETIELMNAVRAKVPHFLEVKSDVLADIAAHGFPVEALPATRTPLGQLFDAHARPLMQLSFVCCQKNRWTPMRNTLKALGATLVISGDRASEPQRLRRMSGDVVEGVEMFFPIFDWSDSDVRRFLGATLPSYYADTESSLECWCCTGYTHADAGRMTYMKRVHPEKLAWVEARLADLRTALSAELANVDRYLDAAAERSTSPAE